MKDLYLQLNILLLLIFMCFKLSAEKVLDVVTLEQAKAHYLLEIIKHIDRDTESNPIVIGLLGENDLLLNTIKRKIAGVRIREKPLFVNNISNESNTKNYYSIIFVAAGRFDDIATIFNRFGPALIVVDGRIPKEAQLVSLVTRGGQISVELNRDNLVHYGFKISNGLLNFAGTKEDLTDQLNEQQYRLHKLIEDAEEKRQIVENVSQALAEKNTALELIKMTLEEKNTTLAKSISKLEASTEQLQTLQHQKQLDRRKIAENKKYISQQKILLESKIIELSQKEASLTELIGNIDRNNEVLGQQNIELQKDREIIHDKEKTINAQRMLLFVALSAIFIILIFIYSTVKLSRMQKSANKELKRLNEQLYELATTDSMTKLFNRRHFIESAQRQINHLQRTGDDGAILMLDIDDFKNVNDTFGHAMGDEAITQVANLLKNNLRKYDSVGRIGGEEYAMLLSQCELDKAKQIAKRLVEGIADLSISHLNQTIKLTISIGLAMIKKDDKDVGEIMQRADIALYKAKSTGKSRVVTDRDD